MQGTNYVLYIHSGVHIGKPAERRQALGVRDDAGLGEHFSSNHRGLLSHCRGG